MLMKKTPWLLIFLSLCLSNTSFAAKITNNISGVGQKDAKVRPYFCIQTPGNHTVEPGKSVNLPDGYVGGALRFDGCGNHNSYLGYAEFEISAANNKVLKYTPPEGVHVTYANPAINSQGIITGEIKYTPIKPNFNLLQSTPKTNQPWPFVGFNLSGLEFSKMIDPVVIPNLSEEDASKEYTDLIETQTFLQAGMNTVRVPVRWAYLQLEGPGVGEINKDYFDSYVKPLLETLTSAKVHTMVDLHSYMRYSTFGKQYAGCAADSEKCPDGSLVTDSKAYEDVWLKLFTLMKNDPKIDMNYIMIDIVNEPVLVPDDLVFTIQANVIKRLQSAGFKGYLLVEGNAWSGLHSWTTASWNSSQGVKYTNATLFTRDNFVKAGITDLSKIIINVHQYLDFDYSGTHNECVSDLTTQGQGGFNLAAFTDYLKQNQLKAMVTEFGTGPDQTSCAPALAKFLNYMQDNSVKHHDNAYGFLGWTIWSTGHGWGGYNLRVKTSSYQTNVMKNYLEPM